MSAVQTWADGFGIWHASVPLSDSRMRDALTARKAILEEIVSREAPYRSVRLKVTRERVTGHGTVVYREV